MAYKTLVFCDDPWHPAQMVRDGLAPLARAGFDFDWFDNGGAWSATRLNDFRLVILAKANATSASDRRPWLTEDSQAAFRDYVDEGNGLLIVHSGTAGYDKLPDIRSLTGGAFLHHPPRCPVTVEPKTDHPLTEGIAPFTVRDEHYFMVRDDASADVFLHARSEHGRQPAGWTRRDGAGRVCVLTPGHDAAVWRHPTFQKLLLNALRWAAKLD